MSTFLPNWAVDMVNAIDDYEDGHIGHEHDPNWPCAKPILDMIPADALMRCRAVQLYLDQTPKPTDAEPDEAPVPSPDTTVADGAWHTVWLEGKWQWITKKMTTEQREVAAAAVERYSAAQEPDADPINVRWWDE